VLRSIAQSFVSSLSGAVEVTRLLFIIEKEESFIYGVHSILGIPVVARLSKVQRWAIMALVAITLIAMLVNTASVLSDPNISTNTRTGSIAFTIATLLLALAAVILPLMHRPHEEVVATDEQIENATSELAQAETLYRQGEHKKAIEKASSVLAILPKKAAAYRVRADANYALGRLASALEDYDAAIALEPGYPFVYSGRAQALRDMGEHEKAIDDWKRTAIFVPELEGTAFQLAMALMLVGRYAEAKSWFENVLADERVFERDKQRANTEIIRLNSLINAALD
jgi:tetratricopeptide (TPR) repeat protein